MRAAVGFFHLHAHHCRNVARNDFLGNVRFGSLVEVRELVGSEQCFAAGCDVLVALVRNCLDFRLYEAFLELSNKSATIFNSLEEVPSGVGYRVCKVFDVVRTCSWVNNLVEVRFFLEDGLHIASNAVREVCWNFERIVVGKNFEVIDTGDDCAHCLGSSAKHIYVCIVNCLVPLAGGCSNLHLLCTFRIATVCLNYVSPQHSCGTELCNFHEVGASNTKQEYHLLCNFFGGQAFVGEARQVFATFRKCESKFLNR